MKRLLSFLFLFLGAVNFHALAAVKVEPGDQVILDKFVEHTHTGLAKLTKEHFEQAKVPETICWVDCPQIHAGLVAYQLTGDVSFLRETAAAIENLRAAAKKGPDGFIGWYGSPEASLMDPAKPDAIISEIQTDFRVVGTVSEFLQLADREPGINKAFARAEWLDLMRNNLVKKWDRAFQDLGSRGAIYQWNQAYKPEKAGITLSHEKMSNMINGLIRLYVITGDDEYMQKAVKLGTFLKHSLELRDGAYDWRFWDYGGSWDDKPGDPAKSKAASWRDALGIWYTATVSSAMQLYRLGFVFHDKDRDRFLKTQTTVCWNGDIANPVYFMTNRTPAGKGEIFASPALSPFNAKLYDLIYTGPAQAFRVQKVDSTWQGGIIAADWLYGKYILNSPADKKHPIDLTLFNRFTHDKANADWLKSIEFEVQPTPVALPPAGK